MLKVGDKFGSYDVVRLLGQGGMGSVFLLMGTDGRLCVAKILDPATAKDHESRVRFLREAEFAQKVKSPYLVETYDVGEDPDTGLCYILMEYVPGGSLKQLLTTRGKLSIKEALSYTRQIALALEEVRQHGIVHRDIKPDNIMFDASGEIKLADLGIARHSSVQSTTITKSGVLMGTPAYMSPEQMVNPHGVDIRSDIYSLGVVLFEMIVGARPYPQATFMELMAKAAKGEDIPDVRTIDPAVPRGVARLIAKMCAAKLARRFATPGELVKAIDAFLSPKPRAFKLPRLNFKPWVILVCCLFLVFYLLPKFFGLLVDAAHVPKEPAYVAKNGDKIYVENVDGLNWYYRLNDKGEAVLSHYKKDSNEHIAAIEPNPTGDIVVPAALNGHKLVRLGTESLKAVKATNIILPDGLREVGPGVFGECDNLKRVRFPDSVEKVDSGGLFRLCRSLEEIDLNRARGFRGGWALFRLSDGKYRIRIDERYSDLKYVNGFLLSRDGERLYFYDDFENLDIKIPEGVKYVEGFSFCGHKARTFTLPASVNLVDANVFYGFKPEVLVFKGNKPTLYSELSLLSPTSTKIFVEEAAQGWPETIGKHKIIRGIAQLEVEPPDYIAKTGEKVYVAEEGGFKFFYVLNKKGEAVLHHPAEDRDHRLTAIEPNPTGEIAIPARLNGHRLVRLERDSLHDLKATKIKFPDTLEEIGVGVFRACSNLKEVRLPDSVRSVDSYFLFMDCTSLELLDLNAAKGFDGWALYGAIRDRDLEIRINESKSDLTFRDGCLVTKADNALMWVPAVTSRRAGETLVLPQGLCKTGIMPFAACSNRTLVIPEELAKVDGAWTWFFKPTRLIFRGDAPKMPGLVEFSKGEDHEVIVNRAAKGWRELKDLKATFADFPAVSGWKAIDVFPKATRRMIAERGARTKKGEKANVYLGRLTGFGGDYRQVESSAVIARNGTFLVSGEEGDVVEFILKDNEKLTLVLPPAKLPQSGMLPDLGVLSFGK